MSVYVSTFDQKITLDAEKWHIDDAGTLHIIGESKNVAAFSRGAWAGVGVHPIPEGCPEPTASPSADSESNVIVNHVTVARSGVEDGATPDDNSAELVLRMVSLMADEPQGDPSIVLDEINLIIADHWGLLDNEVDVDAARYLRNKLSESLG